MWTDYIDAYLFAPDKVEPRSPIRYFPSEASMINPILGLIGACNRKCYYSIMGVQPANPIDPTGRRVLYSGKMIEVREINWAKQANIYKDNSVKFTNIVGKIKISGEIDAVFHTPEDLITLEGIEYKTGSGDYFKGEVYGTPLWGKTKVAVPKADNLLQVMLYLDYFNKPNQSPYILKRFTLIYQDRACSKPTHHEHTVELAPDGGAIVNGSPWPMFNVNGIYQRYNELNSYVEKNEVPPMDYKNYLSQADLKEMYNSGELSKARYLSNLKKQNPMNWHCEYCSYRDRCISDGGCMNQKVLQVGKTEELEVVETLI